ncbi:MAG: hypothetical protein RIF34_05590, partial [Candidatus Kapaibacterium sp.]
AYIGRGNVYKKLEYDNKALEDYTLALEIEPSSPHALLNRGLIFKAKKQNAKAKKDLEKFLEISPRGKLATSVRSWLRTQENKAKKE